MSSLRPSFMLNRYNKVDVFKLADAAKAKFYKKILSYPWDGSMKEPWEEETRRYIRSAKDMRQMFLMLSDEM